MKSFLKLAFVALTATVLSSCCCDRGNDCCERPCAPRCCPAPAPRCCPAPAPRCCDAPPPRCCDAPGGWQ